MAKKYDQRIIVYLSSELRQAAQREADNDAAELGPWIRHQVTEELKRRHAWKPGKGE